MELPTSFLMSHEIFRLGNGAAAYIRKPYQRKEVLDMIVRFVA